MSREEMVKKIKSIMDKYTYNDTKKAHKEMKRIFGDAWCGVTIVQTLVFEYNIIDDENEVCHIYGDWWNGSVE